MKLRYYAKAISLYLDGQIGIQTLFYIFSEKPIAVYGVRGVCIIEQSSTHNKDIRYVGASVTWDNYQHSLLSNAVNPAPAVQAKGEGYYWPLNYQQWLERDNAKQKETRRWIGSIK